MKYMLMMMVPYGAGARGVADWKPEEVKAMVSFMHDLNKDLAASGELVAAEGLDNPSQARIVRGGENGEPMVTDGPFAETKELIAGFSILQVDSMEQAIELVKRIPDVFAGGETEVEIRRLMDVEDFGEAFTPNEEIAKVKF